MGGEEERRDWGKIGFFMGQSRSKKQKKKKKKNQKKKKKKRLG